MVRLKKNGQEALVGKGDASVADYVADGWEIAEELPEEVYDTQGVALPGFSSKAQPKSADAKDDGSGPPLPGLDAEHRRAVAKRAKK